ncbi:MAG: lipid hydroperoxide peroxidase [Flavobacteriales bacterium]|nr:lipid hydroperoxide peroxidase [Flavobacteriales bacterium]|tara:strand:- start:1749 stop:2249 length:501 start_codon:yes stop_codon:yes gene_type:complete
MATVTLKGNQINTIGNLPEIGHEMPKFSLTKNDLSVLSNNDLNGKKVVYNIFPSVDTGTCAASTRRFNQEAAGLENTTVVCISRDLPFAQKRFCGAEGIDNVIMASDFKNGDFGKDLGVIFIDGPLNALLSRSVIVADENGKILFTEQVSETANEPNYEAAIAALK